MRRHQTMTVLGITLAIALSVSITAARCLATDNPEAVIAEQIPRLSDKTQAADAIMKLQALGPAAVPALTAALNQSDQNTRISALGALKEIGDPSAIPAMSKIALSDNPLSDLARQGIAKIGGPDAATCLIGMLNRHVMGDEAGSIARDLGAIGDNRAVEPLSQLLQGQLIGRRREQDAYSDMENISAREAAAEALGHFRDPRATAALKQAVADDPDWDVYFAAREALCRIDQPDSILDWRDLVILAVVKQPEPPEGAEAVVRQWQLDNAGKPVQWNGPSVLNYAAAAEIARARARLVHDAQNPAFASEIVETLMCYLRNRMIVYGPAEAQALIVQIGAPAIPALEIGQKRGDIALKRHCGECLDAIRAKAATRPTP